MLSESLFCARCLLLTPADYVLNPIPYQPLKLILIGLITLLISSATNNLSHL